VDDKMQQGAIDLWMSARKTDFRTACDELSQWMGSRNPLPMKNIPEPQKKIRPPCCFPILRFATTPEVNELAERRGVRPQAVELAIQRGLLWMFDDERNGACWLWTDQRRICGIRRRIDGQEFILKDGHSTKSAACPHSVMSEPLGYLEAVSKPSFAVVEGAPDGLAVYDQAIAMGKPYHVAPIVMPCSSAHFTIESLRELEGKRGRIFADNDQAGEKAARAWMKQLSSAGITVDVFSFDDVRNERGEPVKDLNDYCKLPDIPGNSYVMEYAMERAPDMGL
jgi:5S rRNA maturation endonuclease (ribonuclease M5)